MEVCEVCGLVLIFWQARRFITFIDGEFCELYECK